MSILYFVFFKIIEEVEINTNLRVSLWLDKNDQYLMPCQFVKVLKEDNFYMIKVEVLDPDDFIKEQFLEQKFLFGHPGKIIGYGLLKEIS